MCFSAEASFGAGLVCSAIGAMSLRIANKKDLLIAAIPLLFGIQQIIEGFVWLFEGKGFGYFSGFIFITIAFCFWTIYIPIATFVSETDKVKQNLMLLLLPFGLYLSSYGAYSLSFPLRIDLSTNQIQYILSVPSSVFLEYLYSTVVLAPLFLMKNLYLKLFGASVLIFFIVSTLFFNPARFSVWCFFAALSSILIFLAVHQKKFSHI